MTKSNDPRILVVAEFPPGAPGGDWVCIKQHFRGLDWRQVHWWSLSDQGGRYHEFGGQHRSCRIPPRLFPNQRWKGLKSGFVDAFVLPYAARHLLTFIRSVQPDLIFLMARGWMIPLACAVMPRVKAHWHMALHDMPDVDGMVQRLGRERTDRFTRLADVLYRNASSRSVIGPEMGEEMRRRTGVECSHFFRCAIEPEALAQLREAPVPPPDDVIRISYAGTIIAEETFVRLVKALQAIRSRLSRPVKIHLFGSQLYRDREWFEPELIVEHGFVSETELDRLYREGTWGLSIMHLEDIDPRYNRFSFPCKFSMAVASGLPVICIGHPQSPLVRLAQNYRLGIVLTEGDPEAFAENLRRNLEDFPHRGGYRRESLRCAETELNAERNRQQFHQLLAAAQRRDSRPV